MDKIGYLYCLTNPAMPGLVKIGMTLGDPESRASELSGATGVPSPFLVTISKRIMNPIIKETAIHNLLSALGFRINDRREFFSCSLNIVGLLFDFLDGDSVKISDAETIPVFKHQNISVEKLG